MTILLKDEVIQMTHENYKVFSQSDAAREIYEARIKWQRDRNTELYTAIDEAEKRGQNRRQNRNGQKYESGRIGR